MADRIIDDSTKLLQRTALLQFPIQNPFKVMNVEGKVIGSATVSLTEGGLKVELFLDQHTPEAFDIEVDPSRVKVRPFVSIDHILGMTGVIYLE